MDSSYLYNVLPFLKNVGQDRQDQFENYFKKAPLWILDSLRVEVYEAGEILTQENEKADMVFFVGDGKFKATDYRVSGMAYDFMKPTELIAIGGLEVIMEVDTYRTTIQAETRCIVAKLSRKNFEKWIHSDLEAMRLEAKMTCTYIVEEERRNRLYLYLKGTDRLALLFVELYEKCSEKEILYLRENQQELADETGMSLKSVNRTVREFVEKKLITKKGNRILIDADQYERIRGIVNDKIAFR